MIDAFGWSPALQDMFDDVAPPGCIPARVTAQHRGRWDLATAQGEATGQLAGLFAHNAQPGDYPVTGDWVACDYPEGGASLIHAVMPRRTVFKRRAAGGVGEQIIVANVDTALLVCALNGDLNPRRIERYLVATRDSGADGVVVLTKADLCEDPDAAVAEIMAIAGDTPVISVAARTGDGLERLTRWLVPGATLALLGSSGAGKSTLVNALAGHARMATAEIRADDDRGRHTTTHRELITLPNGALIIDTPGMRELGLTAEADALETSFADVTELSGQCRFTDCRHEGEPGCAIGGALKSGRLSEGRWQSYLKLQRELAFEARKNDAAAEAAERARWKAIHKGQKQRSKVRSRAWD